MNNQMQGGWVDLADDRMIAFPSFSFFDMADPGLDAAGLSGYTSEERLLFGLCARLGTEGQSLSVSLPYPDSNLFVRFLYYLHRVRADVLAGIVLGSQFNAPTLWDQPDLVWFGKPRRVFDQLTRIPDLNPCRLSRQSGKGKKLQTGSHNLNRTLVLPFAKHDIDTIELLQRQAHPFAFVIDATPGGIRDSLGNLWECLNLYFPKVPVFLFSALGDRQTDKTIDDLPVHRWYHRLQDRVLWAKKQGDPSPLVSKLTLAEIPDNQIDGRLLSLFQSVYHLQNQVSNGTAQDLFLHAFKFLQRASNLCVPLSLLDTHLNRQSRGGPYPVRSMTRLLDLIDQADLRYGDLQSQKKALYAEMCNLQAMLGTGLTGKGQCLQHYVKSAVQENISTLILVGDQSEEAAVIDAIHQFGLGLLNVEKLVSVKATGSTRSLQSLTQTYSRCVVLSRMWDSHLWWLVGIAKHVIWPFYLCEKSFVANRATDILRSSIASSLDPGGKSELLTYGWQRETTVMDHQTVGEILPTETKLSECRGGYRVEREVVIDYSPDALDLLSKILSEPDSPAESHRQQVEASDGFARIYVEETDTPLCWPDNRPLHRLDDNNGRLEVVSIEDLQPGDVIVCSREGDPYQNLLESLFEIFHGDSAATEPLRWVSFWTNMVDTALERYESVQKLYPVLKRHGCSVQIQTVSTWLRRLRLGPEDESSIVAMAKAVENSDYAEHAAEITRALKTLRSQHQQLGKNLHQALQARAAGATPIRIGKFLLDGDSLDELLDIYTVESIVLAGGKDDHAGCLADLIPRIEKEFGERILLTNRAVSSMQSSTYRHIDKAWDCFSVCYSHLWQNCMGKMTQSEMKKAFRKIGVEFKAKTSAITQGRSRDYLRLYDGKKVDIGAHLALGTARDISRTMRIHYHWDDKLEKIVIHHAGRHLWVLSS